MITFTSGLQLSQIQRFRYHMIADTFIPPQFFFNYYLTYSVCQCLLCKTRCFIQGHLLLLSIAVFGLNATLIFSSNILISQPHSHFSELRWRHWDRSVNQLLTSSASWGVGSPPSFKRSDRVPIFSRGCQSLCR